MFVRCVLRAFAALCLLAGSVATATTNITFTRDEVAQMAALWETDCITISPLANTQYPTYTSNWQYIFPHTTISADGDIHTDMAVNSSGTGSSGNNTGEAPIICEVTNATTTQLSYLDSPTGDAAIFRGIFRLYTEHLGERHFELHPVTELDRWNGVSFTKDTDYHLNVASVADGATHTTSTLTGLIDGSETMSAAIETDNSHVDFVLPSPSVNYVQYDGTVLSPVTTDSTSSYFLVQPNLVPTAILRCRLVANSAAASSAAGLVANQTVTVNALTRTDMQAVGSQIASMSAGQSKTFPRPVELITLGLPAIGPTPTPSPTATPSGSSVANTASLPMSGASNGEGTGIPYPSTINLNGVPGTITSVSVTLNKLTHSFPEDLDILLVGPQGQNVMLMSDVGGSRGISKVNLTFSDSASSALGTGTIRSGTYLPTNLNPSGDKDAFPAPAPPKPFGSTMSIFHGTDPNGTWKLFVLDEFTSGSGSIGGGWSITIGTELAPPTSAVSRKNHGFAGNFDVNLPLIGTPGIESRYGGAAGNYQMVATFAAPVTFNSASVTSGAGSVVNASSSGNQITVNLTGVTTAQKIVVTIFGVNDGVNTGSVAIPMSILVGDTNTDGFVDAIDVAQTKSQSGTAVSSLNFREDVNVDSFIDSTDTSLVKSRSGGSLPTKTIPARESDDFESLIDKRRDIHDRTFVPRMNHE